jgi:hypothetical protein
MLQAALNGNREHPAAHCGNQGEDGILDLCDLLLARGIGIEAGLLSLDDAHAFVSAIEDVLTHGDTGLEQIQHGDGIASWAVNAEPYLGVMGYKPDSRTPRATRWASSSR